MRSVPPYVVNAADVRGSGPTLLMAISECRRSTTSFPVTLTLPQK
jgi:hypothetical protein